MRCPAARGRGAARLLLAAFAGGSVAVAAAADAAGARVLPGIDLRAFDCVAAAGAVVIRSPAGLPAASGRKGACDREKAGQGMPYAADYVFLKKS